MTQAGSLRRYALVSVLDGGSAFLGFLLVETQEPALTFITAAGELRGVDVDARVVPAVNAELAGAILEIDSTARGARLPGNGWTLGLARFFTMHAYRLTLVRIDTYMVTPETDGREDRRRVLEAALAEVGGQ